MSTENFTNQDASTADDLADLHKYVIFSLGEELYGTKLLEVREVVEMLPTKTVPNTVEAFKGVCNLRGQIIGVIDLKNRFKIQSQEVPRPVLLVFETDSGSIAALADKIESVSVIPEQDIQFKLNIVSSIPNKFISGIGKHKDRMITLIDLKAVLSSEELSSVKETNSLAKAS